MTVKTVVRPGTMEEAYRLAQEKNAAIAGGMMWLRLEKKKSIGCLIDLSDLGLDKIEKTGEGLRIGAYVTLRMLETDPGLNEYSHGALAASMKNIVGVQFRNLATVGGSVAGRFGFSDVICVLAALGAEAEYCRAGRIPVEQLIKEGNAPEHDILTSVLLPKALPLACAYQAHRNTAADFPALNCAVAVYPDGITCAVGARPGRAAVLHLPASELSVLHSDAARRAYAEKTAETLALGSNSRASEDYRRALCAVLVRRVLEDADRQIAGKE